MNNNNTEILFWKIIHNKYLLNYIITSIHKLEFKFDLYKEKRRKEIQQQHNDSNNNFDNDDGTSYNSYLNKRIKFKNLKNLEWFIQNNEYELLCDKLINNQFIHVTNSSFKLFIVNCKDIEIISIVIQELKKRNLIPVLDLIEYSIIHNNQIALNYFINYEADSEIYPTTILIAYENCQDLEIIKYLLSIIRIKYNTIVIYNEFVKKKAIKSILSNKNSEIRIKLLEFIFEDNSLYTITKEIPTPSNIVQKNLPIIIPILETIPQIGSLTIDIDKIPYSVYKDCNFQTKRKILNHSYVAKRRTVYQNCTYIQQAQSEKGKGENDFLFIIENLKLRIDELFQTFHKKYLITPEYINKQISSIERDHNSNLSEQIKQLKRILVLESASFPEFRDYFREYHDISVLDPKDTDFNNKFLSYVFSTLDIKGFLYFTINHLSIQMSMDKLSNYRYNSGHHDGMITFGVTYSLFQIEELDYLLDNNQKGIIEFIQNYYNQDLVQISGLIWDSIITYLIASDKCGIKLLDSILNIDGFPKKNILVIKSEFVCQIKPLDKYKWYIELVKSIIKNPGELNQYGRFKGSNPFYSIEYIDFINDNKNSIFKNHLFLSQSTIHEVLDNDNIKFQLSITNLEVANYFKIKFPWVPNHTIYKGIYLNALQNSDLIVLKELERMNIELMTSSNDNLVFKPTTTNTLLDYLTSSNICNGWCKSTFYNVFKDYLKSITQKDETPIVSTFNFQKFRKESINLLVNFIVDINLPLVKLILPSNVDHLQLVSLIELNSFYKKNSKITSFKKVVEMIKYLLNVIPIDKMNYFQPVFNHLYKRVLICKDVTLYEIKIIKKQLLNNGGFELLDNESFHIFNYLLIKSPNLISYILDVILNPNGLSNTTIRILNQLTLKLYNIECTSSIDKILTRDNFSLNSIISSNFKDLFKLLKSMAIQFIKGVDSLKLDIGFLLSIGKFDVILDIQQSKKDNRIMFLENYLIEKLFLVQDLEFLKQFLDLTNGNNGNFNSSIQRLLLLAIRRSNLGIIQMILENSEEDYKIASDDLLEERKPCWFFETDYQVMNYLFNYIDFNDELGLDIFENAFTNIGSIEITQLFFSKFPKSEYLILSNDLLIQTITNGNLNIIKYYYEIGKINNPNQIALVKEKLKLK